MRSSENDRSCNTTLLVVAMTLLLSAPASAVEIAFDELSGGTAELHTCGVHVVGSLWLFASDGLGVSGGAADDMIDGSEWQRYDFDEPQTGVTFEVGSVTDDSGDGVWGRAIVEAFDAAGVSLGIQMIQGVGEKNLTALFGPAPMSRVVVTALGDGLRIDRFGYTELGSVEIDLQNGGYQDPLVLSPTVCDVHVVGSGQVYFSHAAGSAGGGMGIVGGAGANLLDGSEWMRLEFPYPVDELVLESEIQSLDGDFWYGEAVLFAYDESGATLGSTSLQRHSLFGGPLHHTVDVVDRVGVGGISTIEIYSLGDWRRLEQVVYAPEPSVGAGAALLALVGLVRRRCSGRERAA